MTDSRYPRVDAISPEPWSGTLAELAAATGMSGGQIINAIRTRRQDLRKAGLDVVMDQSADGVEKIRIFEVKPELTHEPPKSAELPKPGSNHQSMEERQEPKTEPPPGEPISSKPGAKRILPAAEKRPVDRGGWTWSAATAFTEIMALCGALVFLGSSGSLVPASPNVQRVSETTIPELTASQPSVKPDEAARSSSQSNEPKSIKPSASASQTKPAADEAAARRTRAAAGETRSQTALADRYPDVQPAPKTAVALYKDAATKGDPVAQHKLGLALSSTDRVTAYAWLVMARNRGQDLDQAALNALTRSLTPNEIRAVRYQLGQMYEQGIGCAADPVSADEWYVLGATAGDPRSSEASAALEKRMSQQQIAQAHARTDDWLRRHGVKVAAGRGVE